jgi:hypothetical protein
VLRGHLNRGRLQASSTGAAVMADETIEGGMLA